MLAQLSDFKPDADSVTPLYMQLANKLSAGITSGDWRANEALPSERMLSDMLDISRVTARKAIDMLCDRGMLTRRRGSGTYITPKLEQPLSRLTSFSEELSQRGFTAGSRWLEREIGVAAPLELLSLGLSPNMPVARLRRLRTADDVVMAIETTTIPAIHMPDPHGVTDSLYGYLEARGAIPMRALQHIRAVNANAEQARLAGLAPGAAMLHITRVSYLDSGAAVELTHSFCRSDYYEFVAESRR
ncbi:MULTISPECIES: GntR family transcriptional regulator [Massilia]|uniref:GntR family transcriptional regulator n=2 Tax=Massilia TaxID=149698 RepID=A0A2D2DIJ2_9BURK|nr:MULTISPECIES: GntR family transcriptional regulator [Massilia]CUI08067.1 Predicted transcriptional regulator of N-Acetylglucosamine utilization, GntR family [Janthinobacterium sp. CG23_2]ATQ74789.1 GntR family transcriptional regulator [Massilia violaceinigra]MCE3602218.1 GntR family transcriptional regulator [Massilia antarctica]MCY0914886.1 GntR family transcriptional regulator [Massilia sp. H27-R4]MDQ1817565.1 GntR family transcriptional regulator [Massilia sp. CCM 9210]